LLDSLLRPSTKDAVVFDHRLGRDVEVVEEPSETEISERQQGVSDRQRFSRGRDQESPLDLDDEQARQQREVEMQDVEARDHEEWGMNYDSRKREVYSLLRPHFSHDEAMEYIGKYGLGKMPRSAMSGGIGGRVGRSEGLRGNGLDSDDPVAGIERIEVAGNRHERSGFDPDFGRDQLPPDEIFRDIRRNARRLNGSGRDGLLSFASNQRQQVPQKLASDQTTDSFHSMFPDARRLASDGDGWNR
jgi:hypothetical protein